MTDEEKPDRPPDYRLHIIGPHYAGGTIQIDATPSGGPIFSIPTKTMGFIRRAGSGGKVDWEAVIAILQFGASLQKGIDLDGGDIAPSGRSKFQEILLALLSAARRINRDMLLEETYKLLSERKISRNTAATIAQDVLQENISADAWRKAVDKWALDNGKPKLDLPHGRPTKQKPEN